MTGESYEFKDMNRMTSQNSLADRNSRNSGCYVSTAKGFIMLLFAILIAVLVGVIVYFAGSRTTECNYTFHHEPRAAGSLESDIKTTPSTGDVTLIERCQTLAASGNNQICK